MKKDWISRACPVCRNDSPAEILHTQEFTLPDNHPLPSEYNVVACRKCGTVYADSSADQGAYDKYYEEMSRYDMNYTCPDSVLYLERAKWIKRFVNDQGLSIIDVGCGNGHLLLELKKLGLCNLTGIDPSNKCASDLRANGINGIANSVFTFSTDVKWDCAILSGVLEHIYDVPGIIDIMNQLLRRNGLLFVCVPDASRYRDYDQVPFDYFNIEHINHFDEISLINLGLQHGFRVVALEKSTITLADTTQPIIYCVYESEKTQNTTWKSYSRNCVADYIQRTGNDTIVTSTISRLMESHEEIVLWGAGNFTSRLLANSNLAKCNIVMIVDSDKHKHGRRLGGRSVNSPQTIIEQGNTNTILVAAAVFSDQIVAEIRRMGLTNNIITLGKSHESVI